MHVRVPMSKAVRVSIWLIYKTLLLLQVIFVITQNQSEM